MTKDVYSRAVHGVRWIGFSKIIAQAAAWVSTIFVIRLLSPADYGIMSMAGLVTILAGMLLDAGLGAAFVQRREVPEPVLRSAVTALMIGSAFAILIVQLIASPIAAFFSEPKLAPVLRLISLQFILSALLVVPNALLTAQMRFRELAISQAAFTIIQCLATVALAVFGAGVWSLVIGTLIGSLIRLILLHRQAPPPKGLSWDFSLLRPYLAFSSYLVAQRFAWFWVEQADQFVIGRLMGAAPLGTFSVAKNLAQMPLDRTAEIVNQVSLPSFAAVQGDLERWERGFTKLIRLASAVSFPIFWGMAAVAPTAIPIVLGDKWSSAIVPFMLICAILPLRTAHSLSSTALLAIGRADVSFKTVMLWAAVLTPMFVFGVSYGLEGIAAAWAIGFPLIYLVSAYIISKALRLHWRTMLLPMAAPMIAAAGCAVAARGFELISSQWLSFPLMQLIGQVIAGAIVYIILLRLTSPRLFGEMSDVVLRMTGRNREPVSP